MNRRNFLKVSGLALGSSVFANGLAQETESTDMAIHMRHSLEDVQNLDNLNPVLQENLGVDFSAFEPSDALSLSVPEFAESGASVAVEIAVNLPMEEVKAIHIFVDQNPLPHIMTASLGPRSSQAVFSTKIRVSDVSPVRAVIETLDGRYLLMSQVVAVGEGGCG